MTHNNIVFSWRDHGFHDRYQTGVSLHSHTIYSRENLGFIPQIASRLPIFAGALERGRVRFRRTHGYELDFAKGWWTPPLSARDALDLEQDQIVRSLDLTPLVSLTDHDSIEAGATLQTIGKYRHVPISTEWTVPFGRTFFHLGIHNLPPIHAHAAMDMMEEFTARPRVEALGPLLEWFQSFHQTLIVFNHPCWDEKGIGLTMHEALLQSFLARHRANLHAVELNGLRPWKENRRVLDIASRWSLPVISGGDRHAHEPNAILNLTDALTFDEFVAEVRDGHSQVLFMPQYREPFRLRILHNLCDVLSDQHGHTKGWRLWSDRIFFQLEDGTVKSLTEWFGGGPPLVVDRFVRFTQCLRSKPFTSLLRIACGQREQVVT